jgi:hypothetical protein
LNMFYDVVWWRRNASSLLFCIWIFIIIGVYCNICNIGFLLLISWR